MTTEGRKDDAGKPAVGLLSPGWVRCVRTLYSLPVLETRDDVARATAALASRYPNYTLALLDVAKALEFGARKYAPENWRKVPDAVARYREAFQRHELAWGGGEWNDAETGLSHMAHALCCLMFLWELLE